MDRFLIADNPLSGNGHRAIIQTIKPQAIIECVDGHIDHTKPHRHYSFTNAAGETEPWTLSVSYLSATNDNEQQLLVIDKLLKRAWHWYVAYLQWEEEECV